MITWEVVGVESVSRQDFHFRGSYHKEIYSCYVHIELSNGVKAHGHGSAWSWGPSSDAEETAVRRAYGHLYHEAIPRLKTQYGKLRRV